MLSDQYTRKITTLPLKYLTAFYNHFRNAKVSLFRVKSFDEYIYISDLDKILAILRCV